MIMCKFETLIDQIKNLKVNLKHGINVSFYLFLFIFIYKYFSKQSTFKY